MRSHSVAYRFKVHSDFLYFTGAETAEAFLIIAGEKIYFLSEGFGQEALWEDVALLTEQEKSYLHGVEFGSATRLEEIIQAHLSEFDRLAAPLGIHTKVDAVVQKAVAYGRSRARKTSRVLELCDSRNLIGHLRLYKSEDEIDLMRTAAVLSSEVHQELMQIKWIGKTERDVANFLESEFTRKGMYWTAYETIVAGGERGTTLHARPTTRQLAEGETMLIDAAGEWQGYCADITRVLPVGAKFSAKQRVIYEIVLQSQMEVLKRIRVGETLHGLHMTALQFLNEGLQRHGIREDGKILMPHSTSHWIGMDVHDPCAYSDEAGQPLRLEKGMSFTVEPGLYFRSQDSEYYGIGVRIEDDVVVTDKGCEILTSAPKTVEEIEALRARAAK